MADNQPSPGSRIRPEGADNYYKNRGTIERVAFQQVASSTSSLTFTPSDIPRCPTSASRANYKLSVFGNVGRVLDGSATPRPATAPPRIKPEAADIATISQGVRVRPIIHQKPRRAVTPRVPRVKPEGEAIASVSKGKRMRILIHEFAQHAPTPRYPRVKTEAEVTAEVAKGGRMYNLLHKYGTLPLSARSAQGSNLQVKTTPSWTGQRMDNLIHKYGRNDVTPRAPPRVKKEGEDNADLDRGKRMATLVHSYTLPRSARRAPRVKPQAARSAELGRGVRMEKLMHAIHTITPSPRPVSRAIGSQARRNLWRGWWGGWGSV